MASPNVNWSKLAVLICTALFVTFLLSGSVKGQDNVCLGCLCESSTSCNITTGCFSPAPQGGFFCGPFYISRDYWIDAGSPVLGGDVATRPGAFEVCANDMFCAANTVMAYMKKFATEDCNGDGRVDCQDFAHIHVLGGYACKSPAFQTSPFFQRFTRCMNVLNAAKAIEP